MWLGLIPRPPPTGVLYHMNDITGREKVVNWVQVAGAQNGKADV